MKKKKVCVYLDNDILERVKEYCLEKDSNISREIRALLKELIKNNSKVL